MLTQARLLEVLEYVPDTGDWVWIRSPRPGWEGKPAGSFDARGYKKIKIGGKSYFCSRLAFLYMTGEWPADEADHIDGNTRNDRWNNLRSATRRENVINRGMFCCNTSGVIGVHWVPDRQKWRAQIDRTYLGLFDTIQEAKLAREEAVMKMHGAYARTSNLQEAVS